MIRIRPHRTSFAESVKDQRSIEPTMKAVCSFVNEFAFFPVEESTISVQRYGFDSRIGMDVYSVEANGIIYAWTDAQVIR